jgi:hypothetical protein
MPSTAHTIHVDIAIIGGGIAGLWLLNLAVNAGYHAVLFEQTALGSGQTIASQGMIHGGVKYTLTGALSGASEAIADMPDHWRRCMDGTGDVDLRGTRILSDHFYMWSAHSTASKITTFLASKALRGRVDAQKKSAFPAIFSNPAFKGSLYKLVDMVVDTHSLIDTLYKPQKDRIFAIDWRQAQLQRNTDGADIIIPLGEEIFSINSQLCVLAAGKGNADLLKKLSVKNPVMQLRPLQQVMVRHRYHDPLYAHCVGTDSKPRLTISSHRDGEYTVWYLGGQLAEDGVHISADALIARAKTELQTLFSWLDWCDAEWSTFCVDRAEPTQPGLLRPDNAWLSACDDLSRCVVAWPTKLTLMPNLGNLLMNYLQQQQITPRHTDELPDELPDVLPRLHEINSDNIAPAPWQTAHWIK